MFKKLWNEGKLPTIETSVGIDTSSFTRAALISFVLVVMVILAFYSIRKLAK